MPKSSRLPLKSVGLLTGLNALGAIVGLGQTIVIAAVFGATRSIEIFFAAMTFQTLLLKLANSGQVGDLFVPIFHHLEENYGHDEARRAFAAITNVMLLVTLSLLIVSAVFVIPITKVLVPGFSEADRLLCADVFLAVLPVIMIQIANAMFDDLLQAEHRYGVQEGLAVISRIANLCAIMLLWQAWGIWSLIVGVWIAAVIRLIGQLFIAFRAGYRHAWRIRTLWFRPRQVIFKIPLSLTHVFGAQLFAVALTAMLSALPEGTYAAYSYAKLLYSKLQSIVLQPIGMVFFNHFSQGLARGGTGIRHLAEHALALSIAVVASTFVPIVVAGDLVLAAIWGGEKFSPSRIHESYVVLSILTGLLILDAQYLVSRRTNLAIRVIGAQFAATSAVMLLSTLLCYKMIPTFGIYGAALVDSVAIIGTASTTILVLWATRPDLAATLPWDRFWKWMVATICAIGVGRLVRGNALGELDLSRGALIARAALSISLAISVCFAISIALNVPESKDILKRAFERFFRRVSGKATEPVESIQQ